MRRQAAGKRQRGECERRGSRHRYVPFLFFLWHNFFPVAPQRSPPPLFPRLPSPQLDQKSMGRKLHRAIIRVGRRVIALSGESRKLVSEFIRHGLQMVIHNGGFGPPLMQFSLIIDRYGLSGLKFSSRGALGGILSRVFFIFSLCNVTQR